MESPTSTFPADAPCQVPLTAEKRVGAFLQAWASGRAVTDDEIHQHARDCTFLMESSYDRFQALGTVADREAAYEWMHRRDEALRSLSPEWKAARAAQIERAVGVDYFLEQADRDRAGRGTS